MFAVKGLHEHRAGAVTCMKLCSTQPSRAAVSMVSYKLPAERSYFLAI